jgi:membrane dipeptidase
MVTAEQLHRSAIVIDGHNDLPYRLRSRYKSDLDRFDLSVRHSSGHTDIPRLKEGGINAQFLAAYVPSSYEGRGPAKIVRELIGLVHQLAARYPEFELAKTAADVRRIAGEGKIALIVAVEGGHAIENSLDVLREFHALGVRYLTLTHSSSTDWADSATDEPRHHGLSTFGEQVVREMNDLGMLVDISHVSDETMKAVLQVSRAPIIASHSGARAVNNHPRNVPDDVLKRMADGGGVAMVNFFPGFVVPEAASIVHDMFDLERRLRAKHGDDDAAVERDWRDYWADREFPRGSVKHLVDHIDHIVHTVGIDHVGLGSDFDGISMVPEGLEDVSAYPVITEELVRRRYSEDDVRKILGENVLRVMAAAEDAAR